MGIDARAARFAAQLVIGFELVGGFDNRRRAFNGTAAIADGFFVWHGNDVETRPAGCWLLDFRAEENSLGHGLLCQVAF